MKLGFWGSIRSQLKLGTILASGGAADTTPPSVTGFAATTPNIGGTIAITTFTASEAGVSWLITVSSTPPASGAAGWSGTAPTTFDATSEGSCTLYPWVKDAAGNVSTVYGSPVAVSVYETPAYGNAGGTGDRTALITSTSDIQFMTNNPSLNVDGITTAQNTNYFNAVAVAGKFVKFQFNGPKVINEIRMILSGNAATQGVWKWQGSTDNSVWVDIGASFGSGAWNTPYVITTLSANVTPYTYYRMLGVSGNGGNDKYVYEFEFKIGNLIP